MRESVVVRRRMLAGFARCFGLAFALAHPCRAAAGDLEDALPSPRLTVKALDLSKVPSTEEIMASGQLGGLLHPTHTLKDAQRAAAANLSFGTALEAWNRHDYVKGTELFRQHAKDFPDSPWVAEALLHVGCDATYLGRITEAESLFSALISAYGSSNHPGARMMANKAKSRLALVKFQQNDFDAAGTLFTDLAQNATDWRQRTYASHWLQRLSRYSAQKKSMLNCGVLALAEMLRQMDLATAADDVAGLLPQNDVGFNMKSLVDVAAQHGVMLSARMLSIAELQKLPLPAIVQIDGGNATDHGHYWVVEKVTPTGIEARDPQQRTLFVQSLEEFASQWQGRALLVDRGRSLPGKEIPPDELASVAGGCCGVNRPTTELGDPGRNGATPGRSGCPNGAPVWNVNVVSLNLYVHDIPLWYQPAIGPSVNISLSYNSQAALAVYEPFGNKWQFNYASYLVVNPASTVTIFMPDGRIDEYQPSGTNYIRPYQVFNTLVKIASNRFDLRFPDDTVYEYGIPAGTASLQPFLTGIRDVYGNRLSIGYNASVQLTTITDAKGAVTTLKYGPGNTVTNITDPFSRSASFSYDVAGNLTRIVDMGGYWSSLTYDPSTNVYLTSIANERGATLFRVEPSDSNTANPNNYPPPGDRMYGNYRVTVTDPIGGMEEFFYLGGCDNADNYGCGGFTWHVTPRFYIPWQSQAVNNYWSHVPKTRYYFTQPAYAQGEIERIAYPDGAPDKTQRFQYDGNGNRTRITDPHGHAVNMTYNTNGLVTYVQDARGTVTRFGYASNSVDLTTISNGLGVVRMTYDTNHNLTAVTDRLTNTTTFTYNSYGQILTQIDALKNTNSYAYDGSNRLWQVRRAGQLLETVTYDTINRVKTRTDATGLMLTYGYNALNQVTNVLYPDGKSEKFAYSTCCPRLLDRSTDRAGRNTWFNYDELRRLTKVTQPDGTLIRYEYDADGNMTNLLDPNGVSTKFAFDAMNRLVRKTYADGKGPTYAYDIAGLLTNKTNARGMSIRYYYNENHQLVASWPTDPVTPFVHYEYDAYGRPTKIVDGIGTNFLTYDANSRVLAKDGPWDNDTITYGYDATGRRTNLNVQGGSGPTTYAYDSLGRYSGIGTPSGTFVYSYSNANPIVQKMTRPNGSYTAYSFDTLNRLTGISNRKSTHEIINQYLYTYNAQDLRDSETVSNGLAVTYLSNSVVRYDYNNLNQLLTSAPPAQVFAYDDDGNMIRGYTPSGYVFTATYDAENRLASTVFTNAMGVVLSNQYFYAASSFLARQVTRSNGVVGTDLRIPREGSLDLQERGTANNVNCEYTWGLNLGGGVGGLLCLRRDGNDVNYGYDGRGNVVCIVDAGQASVASYAYDAFGSLVSSGLYPQDFRFSTKRLDALTGIAYFGFRHYSAVVSKWLSRDPIGELGGVNIYAFVGNNPIASIDALGMSCSEAQIKNAVDVIKISETDIQKYQKLMESDLAGAEGREYWYKYHHQPGTILTDKQGASCRIDEHGQAQPIPTDPLIDEFHEKFHREYQDWRGVDSVRDAAAKEVEAHQYTIRKVREWLQNGCPRLR